MCVAPARHNTRIPGDLRNVLKFTGNERTRAREVRLERKNTHRCVPHEHVRSEKGLSSSRWPGICLHFETFVLIILFNLNAFEHTKKQTCANHLKIFLEKEVKSQQTGAIRLLRWTTRRAARGFPSKTWRKFMTISTYFFFFGLFLLVCLLRDCALVESSQCAVMCNSAATAAIRPRMEKNHPANTLSDSLVELLCRIWGLGNACNSQHIATCFPMPRYSST